MALWLKMWARGVLAVLLCLEIARLLIPIRASNKAVVAPDGPLPMMRTGTSMSQGMLARV